MKEDKPIIISAEPKFDIGKLVVTAGVYQLMQTDKSFDKFVRVSIERYVRGDWGNTCEEDAKLNDVSIEQGARILAVYIHMKSNTKIWIITEWDRSATTILFPSEY